MREGRIRLVAASAGTGKTWRLCEELYRAVVSGVPPQRILATTFTNRAAAELLARGRARLLAAGLTEAARDLMLARIGTVNGLFGRLVAEQALPQGRSPVAAVLPEGAQKRLFRVAADATIGDHAATLEALAERFGFHDRRPTRLDWRDLLADLVAQARCNRIDAAGLASSAEASWAGLRAALPAPTADGPALDAELAEAIGQALVALGDGDGQKNTGGAIDALREAGPLLAAGRLGWAGWVALTKVAPAKRLEGCVLPVRAAAARHAEHPRLHADLEAFIRTLFTSAATAMEEAQSHKRRRGLVDFTDQEAEALALLEDPIAADAILGGIDVMLVDEFQDTSPIQLALFDRLARGVPQTLLVGDAKQAIYGFRGADPTLVAAVGARLAATAGAVPHETLDENRRSRPALVDLPQRLLGPAFAALGIDPGRVPVRPFRQDLSGQGPPVALWRVPGSKQETARAALAARIARLLAEGERWPVAPRGEQGRTRPLRGGDVAVLMHTNEHARQVADALAEAGVKVALERAGLLDRAECVLALAGLRALADASDTMALAEIAHLLEGDAESPAWLRAALTKGEAALQAMPFAEAIAAARPDLARLTPGEALQRAIALLDLPARLAGWGDAAGRQAALDALRALAAEYEAECLRERLPGSAAGLAAWLAGNDEAKQPASPDPDAVQVMTVHSAKGLEWPCVVLADLSVNDEARLFNAVAAMPAEAGLDPDDPLRGRWLRVWPWPYGALSKGTGLDARAEVTQEGQAANAALAAEKLRLLYVALTRPRDYLVLAPRLTKGKLETGWLALVPEAPLDLPAAGDAVRLGGVCLPMAVEDLPDAADAAAGFAEAWTSSLPEGPAPDHLPRALRPSAAIGSAAPADFQVDTIGPRLPLAGAVDMQRLGEALHGFFAADRPGAARDWRLGCAARLLATWEVTALSAADAVAAADRLWAHLAGAFPGARLRAEWPVRQVKDGRVLTGRVDLVVEHAEGLAVVDHKSFPGGAEHWPARVAEHAPQVGAYAAVLEAATGRRVTRRALHLPVGGVVLSWG